MLHAEPAVASEALRDGIVTPEAVVLEIERAGFASRLASGAIDAVVQIGVLVVLALLLSLTARAGGLTSNQVNNTILGISVFVTMFGYPLVCEMVFRGRTFGKMALGLRAVTVEGSPLRFRHAALRAMGGIVDKWVPPGGVVGVCFMLGTPGRQRIGDLLAGTMVISDPNRTALPQGLWFPVPPGLEGYAATIDPNAITVEQYTVIRSFLLRQRELHHVARAAVAADLADRVGVTIGHQRHPHVAAEAFLMCVIARYQRRAFPAYQPTSWSPR